ncbi:MAG TPA: ATP-binding protein [Bacteroidales bacterium]|nr:ATP-binding protein [Bacteroidales bacterium]
MSIFINRAIKNLFLTKLQANKVLIIAGARRVGKTLFLKDLMENYFEEPFLFLNGEEITTIDVLSTRTAENYKRLLGNTKLFILDEAQKIPDIGLILKLMIDTIDGLKIIATGSSVFDLTNNLGEPLTGRKYTFLMFPFAQMEFSNYENLVETKARLEERMIYGCYPELLSLKSNSEKSDYLNEIVSSYLLRDILAFDGIKNSDKMLNLLRLIAFQTGKEVSLEELGRQLGLSRNTVERYLDLLTKVFVIYKIPGFSRNLRTEIVKTSRWYFFDNGILNTMLNNFNPLSSRKDTGELWENYVLSERIKFQHYTGLRTNNYFWRTYQQQEIDWIEERQGNLFAYEIKWNPRKMPKAPLAWTRAYPESSYRVITPDNYLDWIAPIEE